MFVHETLSIRINAGRRAIPPCHLPPLVNRVPVFLRIRFAASSFLFRCPRPLSRNSTAARPSSVCACPPARYSSFDRYSLLFAQDQDRPSVRHSGVRQSQERRHFPRPQRLTRRERGSREEEEIYPLFVSVEGGGRSSSLCRSVSRLQPVTVGLFGHFLWPVRHSPTAHQKEYLKR